MLAAELMNAEAQAPRQEHVTILNAIVALDVAALGSGMAVIGTSAFVPVALATVSSFFVAAWTDRSLSILKIALTSV